MTWIPKKFESEESEKGKFDSEPERDGIKGRELELGVPDGELE